MHVQTKSKNVYSEVIHKHIIYNIYISFAYFTHAHYILIIASEAKTLHKHQRRHFMENLGKFFHRQSRECHGGSWESWNVDVESSWLLHFFGGGALSELVWLVLFCFVALAGLWFLEKIDINPEISRVQGLDSMRFALPPAKAPALAAVQRVWRLWWMYQKTFRDVPFQSGTDGWWMETNEWCMIVCRLSCCMLPSLWL